MPLGDDQKAMLRLLAREQSYEDIAALMGLSVDEVANRARGAVEQLESEGIPAPALPDAPGGSAPEPPAPKVEKTPKQPEPVAAASPPPPPPPPPRPAKPKQPRDRNMLLAIGAGVAGLIVIVVLGVLLISNSDGDGDSSSGGETTVAENGGSATREPTVAQLAAVDGSDASGKAEFGRVKDSLALGVKATGVEPAPKGQIYMVWLADTPQKMLPLTALVANKAGRINASYQVPTEAVIYLASGEFDRLVITRTVNSELRKSLEQANQDKDFPAYTGDPVLEGQVEGPILGAAKRLEERQQDRKEEAE